MNSFEKLQTIKLPSKKKFYNALNNGDVIKADYKHAQKVWKKIGITSMREYHNLYLKTDVPSDMFENFRDLCLKNYQLDPACYYTAPGLAYDAALKITNLKRDSYLPRHVVDF